ncbi:MAG: hypothetical protein R3B57_06820 [Phycisphaerales bacterium]
MRCRRCDYQLWNLTSRTCPECGDPFLPSDYTFRPGSVEFHCPHCKQRYFGANERGHLEPPIFSCVGCGRSVTMDEMILTPAEGVDPEATVIDRNPWIRRAQLGSKRAWWQTSVLGMINPIKLARVTPHDAALAPAWGFATLNIVITILLSIGLLMALFAVMMLLSMATSGARGAALGFAYTMLGFLIMGAIGFVVQMLYMLLWIGFTHLLVKCSGGAPRPMRTTALAILYTSGANLPVAIPCANYFVWLWWPITAGIALKSMQGIAAWRAITASVVTPVIIIAGFVAAYIAFFMWMTSLMSSLNTSMSTRFAEINLANAYSAIVQYENGANPPRHALEMINSHALTPSSLVLASSSSLTTLPDIPAGGVSLAEFTALPSDEQQAITDVVADSLPDDVVAHRLGDLVFTYHGFNSRTDPDLWLVILSPDPDANPGAEDIDGFLWALHSDGSVEEINFFDFDDMLADQNKLRASHNLPPLPHPSEVRHAIPAVAPPVSAP